MVNERIDRILAGMASLKSDRRHNAGLVLPALQKIQREFGFLPNEAVARVATFTGVPDSHVYGVATFYAHFKFTPPGRHHATVCCGTACHVRGSAQIVTDLSDRFGIQPGETSTDGEFSLETTACFGSCALAPVVVIDDHVYGRMNRSRLTRIISQLDAARATAAEEK